MVIVLTGIALGGFVFAQQTQQLPNLPGAPSLSGTITVPQYFSYIYWLIITIAGLIAFGVMIWAGFAYVTSAGNPARISEAKNRILQGLFGLLILLGSYIIFNTINPQLTRLSFERPPAKPIIVLSELEKLQGVLFFCKKSCSKDDLNCIQDYCKQLSGEQPIPAGYTEILSLRGENPPFNYALLFEQNPKGKQKFSACGVFTDQQSKSTPSQKIGLSPSEAKYTIVGAYPGFNDNESEGVTIKFCENAQCEGDGDEYPFQTAPGHFASYAWPTERKIRAMKIEKGEVEWIVLFKNPGFDGECYITRTSELQFGANFGEQHTLTSPQGITYYAQVGSFFVIPKK